MMVDITAYSCHFFLTDFVWGNPQLQFTLLHAMYSTGTYAIRFVLRAAALQWQCTQDGSVCVLLQMRTQILQPNVQRAHQEDVYLMSPFHVPIRPLSQLSSTHPLHVSS